MKARELIFPSAVGLGAVATAMALSGRSQGGWHLPFMYEEDAVNVLGIVKMGLERGWASGSARLGAPGALDLAYYPMAEQGQLGLIQLLGLFGGDAATTVNAYLLLTFFLAGATATWALRRLGVGAALACLGGLAFTLLPCHFWRGTCHMFVAGYYIVPLVSLALLDYRVSDKRVWMYLAFAFVSPLVNTYYTFFFCFLLGALAICDAVALRSRAPLLRGAQFACAVGAGFVTNMGRSLPLHLQHKLGFFRPPQDSELYGLKLTLMVMPIFATVSDYVGRAYELYTRSAPLVTENKLTDLGLVVGCAFLATFAYGFYMLARNEVRTNNATSAAGASTSAAHGNDLLLRRAAMCALMCIVLATIGGVLAIFSYLVSPLIRSSNRIEVYVAFFALVVGLHLLQPHIEGAALRLSSRRVLVGWAACLVLFGILCWDLSHRPLAPDYAKNDPMYQRDVAFFTQLEQNLEPGTRILNLPYVPFPEGGIGPGDYDHLRAFIHTNTLVWSFGAIRNTPEAEFNRNTEYMLVSGQTASFQEAMQKQNFRGVLVNRHVQALLRRNDEALLTQMFGQPSYTDAAGEFLYYKIPRSEPG